MRWEPAGTSRFVKDIVLSSGADQMFPFLFCMITLFLTLNNLKLKNRNQIQNRVWSAASSEALSTEKKTWTCWIESGRGP